MALSPVHTILAAVAAPEDRIQPVIDRAAQLAAALNAKLVLFHAAFDSALSGRPFFDNKRLARSRGAYVADRTRALERRARALRQRDIATDVIVIWEEPAYEAIIRAATRDDADLVVAGPHAPGRPGARPALRQTDWQLLRLCPRPLLLVRSAGAAARRGAVLAALDPTHANDKPATLDRSLLQWGGTIAAALDEELHGVHGIARSVFAPGEETPAARKKMQERIRRRIAAEVKSTGVTMTRAHVVPGRAEVSVPAAAQKIDAQLLVMGALSRRGLQRLAIGDTAERIIHAVDCDLLIVKPEGFKLKLGKARREPVLGS